MIAWIAALIVMQSDGVGLAPEAIGAYRDALQDEVQTAAPMVAFADLWNNPEKYRGRRVSVEGSVVREFHAPVSGELPPRVEVWIEDAARNLVCVVFPNPGRSQSFAGRTTATGTSLGLVRYQSGDSVRLAPLIVGPSVPLDRGASTLGNGSSWDATSWLVAAGAVAVVAIFLARSFALRPPGPREFPGPGVEFES